MAILKTLGRLFRGNDSPPATPSCHPTRDARRSAEQWWQTSPRHSAACDRCSSDIPRGGGYLRTPGMFGGADLLCHECWYSHVGQTPPEEEAARRERLRRRRPTRTIGPWPNRPRGVAFDPPLTLSIEDYRELFRSMGCPLREGEHAFGTCRVCHANRVSAALLEWAPGEDWCAVMIAYACPNAECEGNETISHSFSSTLSPTLDAPIWQFILRRKVPNDAMYPEPDPAKPG